ncbi:MAG: fluoride efflux transporter CrcB [Verrucomicrobiae bacterium]|nr:fluoride efflux transporter CrcB [Verrucomicrobiae bacterium]
MKAFLLVAFGGASGALLRWFVAGGVDWLVGKTGGAAIGPKFPWGILAANLLGCLVIGLLYGLAETRDWLTDATRWLLFVGFLGSFTTFSTFGWNSFELIREGHLGMGLANVGASVILGLLCVWVGYAMGR